MLLPPKTDKQLLGHLVEARHDLRRLQEWVEEAGLEGAVTVFAAVNIMEQLDEVVVMNEVVPTQRGRVVLCGVALHCGALAVLEEDLVKCAADAIKVVPER